MNDEVKPSPFGEGAPEWGRERCGSILLKRNRLGEMVLALFRPRFRLAIFPKGEGFYKPRHSMKMGICFSQLASEWFPPGTIRSARFTRLVSSRWAVEIMAS